MVSTHFHFNGFFPNMLYFFSCLFCRLYLFTPTFIIEPKNKRTDGSELPSVLLVFFVLQGNFRIINSLYCGFIEIYNDIGINRVKYGELGYS